MDLTAATNETPALVNSIMGIVMIIKLMISGHPRSKPYYEEICSSMTKSNATEHTLNVRYISHQYYESKVLHNTEVT